jgi:hypothetical protein
VIRSKLGLKALGLCAMVLGLVAISAGAAQADVGAHWNVNGKSYETSEKEKAEGTTIEKTLPVELGAALETDGTLLSKALGGTSFNILCTGMNFENAVLKAVGGSLGRIRFSGCKIFLGGKESVPCEPHTVTGGVDERGVILTVLLKDLIVLHEEEVSPGVKKNEPVDRLEPEEGETFVTIQTSAECSVGGKAGIPVIGKFTLKDCQHEGRVEKVTHLGDELAALTEMWILSKTVEHKATIDGSANVSLIKAHEKLTWSGTPA